MERNALSPEAMVSCIFTLTEDLDAEFPAVAARRLGLDRVPLLCTREVPVPGSLPRVIRTLMHYYAARGPRAPARLPAARRASCAATSNRHNKGRMAIEFGERIRRIPAYPLAAGYDLGADVAMLASNESCFAPHPDVIAAAHEALAGAHRYPDPSYAPLRRRSV